MRRGYIYLIRERQFLEKDQDVFRIGRSQQDANLKLNRLDSYKKGGEILHMICVPADAEIQIEKDLLSEFRQKFQLYSDGNSKFVGSPQQMMDIISKKSIQINRCFRSPTQSDSSFLSPERFKSIEIENRKLKLENLLMKMREEERN